MLNEKFEMWRLTGVTEFGDNEEPLATVAEDMEARARSKRIGGNLFVHSRCIKNVKLQMYRALAWFSSFVGGQMRVL